MVPSPDSREMAREDVLYRCSDRAVMAKLNALRPWEISHFTHLAGVVLIDLLVISVSFVNFAKKAVSLPD